MKLWEKDVNPEPSVIEFTSGKDRITDLSLAEWDIAGSMAHAIMLREAGLISDDEKAELLKTLYSLFEKLKEGSFTIEEGIEDIHSQIEKELCYRPWRYREENTYRKVKKRSGAGRCKALQQKRN